MPTAQTPPQTKQSEQALTGRLTDIALNYQKMLELDPRRPEALVGMSLVALASRQIEAAVNMAAAGATVAPGMSTAWVALGQALKAAGRNDEAESAYGKAIRLNGMDSLARMGLGELKIASGRPQEAALEFERALRQRPSLVAAVLGLGNALAFMGRHAEALARYEQALAIEPRLPEALFAAGFALARLGRTEEAVARYRRAIALRPDFAAAWMNLGSLLREQGNEAYAEAALHRATELRPDLISGWVNLAILERGRRRPAEAESHLRKAFGLDPDQIETQIAWCRFRAAERDSAGAWAWLRWARARDPDHSEVINMEGILLQNERRFEEAIAAFKRAEALGSQAATSNRGNSLLDLGRMDEALRAHEAAAACDPPSPGALYNLALTELRLGDWERGWADYEARWRFREVHRAPRRFAQPRWRGEALQGQRVLLHAEQGLGDTIQFCRYAALVVARGGAPILEVQGPVERLMRSLPVVRAGLAETRKLGACRGAASEAGSGLDEGIDFDMECPLMSLPAVFGTKVHMVPWPGAYLGAEPLEAAEKRLEFPDLGPGPRVGIAWAGNPRYKADQLRSTRLVTLLPLIQAIGATWISLQKGEAGGQLDGLPGDVCVLDGSSRDRDLAETAALITTLDLVITTDTSIAHLAGAIGKPVWILLPHLADWRWMQDAETTPWYPTARLLRQGAPGDWEGLIGRVIDNLKQFIHQRAL